MAMCTTGHNALAASPRNSTILGWLVVSVTDSSMGPSTDVALLASSESMEISTYRHFAACGPSASGLKTAKSTAIAQARITVM